MACWSKSGWALFLAFASSAVWVASRSRETATDFATSLSPIFSVRSLATIWLASLAAAAGSFSWSAESTPGSSYESPPPRLSSAISRA